ncbi:MAG: hypothetical protein IIC12_06340 [Proteobacteria bacterium]|nr:hypothetical protein [Pseudomonadota bacterium]
MGMTGGVSAQPMATSAGVVAQLIEIAKISAKSARDFTRGDLFNRLLALFTAFLPGGGGDLDVAFDLVALGLGNDRSGVRFVALLLDEFQLDKQTEKCEGCGTEGPGAGLEFE